MKKQKNVLLFYSRLVCGGGLFKSRLGKELQNQQQANELAMALIYDLLQELSPKNSEYDFVYFYQPGEGDNTQCIEKLQEAYPSLQFIGQNDEMDVEKIGDAFTEFLAKGYEKITMVGSDIPQLSKQIIDRSFQELESMDIIMQPTEDKGYALIGIHGNKDVFSDIKNWQSRTENYDLAKETRDICHAKGYKLMELSPKMVDMDYLEDIKTIISIISEHGKLKKEYRYLDRFFSRIQSSEILPIFQP